MKRNIKLIFAACATMMAAACTKQVQNETVQSPEFMAKEPMSITCVSNGTKTQLAEGGKVNWSEGDQLKIFTTGTTYEGVADEKFDLNIEEGNLTQATFEGEVAEGTTAFVALYPYSENASFDGSILTTEIPTSQSATAGNFAEGAALAWAKGTKTIGNPTVGVQMQNICALMAFTLPENITFAKKVTITANAENAHVAGAVQVNVGTGEISYVGGNSVELSGDFVGGNVYYTTIAPGTYDGGFTFVIETEAGNTYTRQNTKTVVAGNGSIAKLGTLSLVLSDSDINCNVVISHNVESGILTGSTATASVSVATEEFQSLVTINSVDIKLKQGETIFRSLSAKGADLVPAGQAMTMTPAEDKPYLPKGEYNYEAVVNYSVGSLNREVTVNGKATSLAPADIKFGATLKGYTSYSTYTGADGQTKSTTNANEKDGSTIYGIGAEYASGLSEEVYNQCLDLNLLSVASTLDGDAKSGDAASQSWKAHTIGAKVTFDGVDFTASDTKTVHVTGLPYNKNKAVYGNGMNNGEWVQKSGGKYEINNNPKYLRIGSNGSVTLTLNIPGDRDIDTNISYRIDEYLSSRLNYCKTGFVAGGTTILDTEDGGTATTKKYESSTTIKFTASANNVVVSQKNGNTPTWGSAHPQLYYISILYN